MGTFKVPDLKAKRIVGNGPVYGPNTPNVGNSELGVGIDTIDGNWYMDKNAQKGQFSWVILLLQITLMLLIL